MADAGGRRQSLKPQGLSKADMQAATALTYLCFYHVQYGGKTTGSFALMKG